MPAPIPEPDEEHLLAGVSGPGEPHAGAPSPEGEQPAREIWGGPGWAWAEGSAETGPVFACERPGPQPAARDADGLPTGLDYPALVEALAASGALDGDPENQDAEILDQMAAAEEGRMRPTDPAAVAAQAVEYMTPGPAQAGWLEVAAVAVERLDENALAGVAIAARQAAARAQAAELAAVAQITARAAAADPKIGVLADGRPARVCRDALGQISLALMLTHYGAEAWADLAVTLAWRLSATGKALAAGRIDLDRARLIAEVTSVLSEEQARTVERKILPAAGGLTRTQLRERLTRAVIAADPDGAERRREQAERQADVRLHADDDQTATLTGSKLPQVHAAAGFARLTALARACKAAGMPGSLGFHRAQVMIGLLLGTLPYIPRPRALRPTSLHPVPTPAPVTTTAPARTASVPRTAATRAAWPRPAAACVTTASMTRASGMTCPLPVMRTPRPTTASTTTARPGKTSPATPPTRMRTCTGPVRCRRGRGWA